MAISLKSKNIPDEVGRILEKVKEALDPQGRYLVAVSGGIDSTVLLHAVKCVSEGMGLYLEVVHVDHRLRENSKNDAEAVKRFCESLELKCHVVTLAPTETTNIEAWGRENRYKVFKQILRERDLSYTLTAHNANDCVETMLMRLIANKELRGISYKDDRLRVIRPLLYIFRREIEEYVSFYGLRFVEDRTNEDTRFLRNRVRHRLLPFLQENFEGDVVRILHEQAQNFVENYLVLDTCVDEEIKRIAKERNVEPKMENMQAIIEGCRKELRWRVCERLLEERIGFKVGKRHAERVLGMVERKEGGKVIELPGGTKIVKRKSIVTLME